MGLQVKPYAQIKDMRKSMGKDICGGKFGSIQVFSGLEFFPLNPNPQDISIDDIAHALSIQVRFSGHIVHPYTVAEHSVCVSYLVPQQYALWGLLHDAAEAYLVDLPRPLKHDVSMSRYREAEEKLMRAISTRFDLNWPEPPIIKTADRLM